MWIQINWRYHETVMPVILSLFIKSTFSSTAWKSAASTPRRAKQMSRQVHTQHKELIHAREIQLTALKIALVQNTTHPLMAVFVGFVLNFLQAFQIKSK